VYLSGATAEIITAARQAGLGTSLGTFNRTSGAPGYLIARCNSYRPLYEPNPSVEGLTVD